MKKNIALFSLILLGLGGCAKKEDTKSHEKSFAQLSHEALESIKAEKRTQAISHLEQLMLRYPDTPDIAKYKILLAEQYFKTERYASAQELYDHFQHFYPADDRAEYAKYKSILAMYNQTLHRDCDQSETERAIRLCHEYLQNLNFKQYQKDVFDIQNTCEQKLIDKEIYVYNFYLKRGECDAARNRLKHLTNRFLEKHEELGPRLLYLECKLAKREKDNDVMNTNLTALLNKYPDSQYTQMAKGLIKNSNTFTF